MLDAPVSGGEPKAIDGTISVMVGGKKEIFDKYFALLKAMSGSVVYVGEIGSGNVAKLANQIIVALNIASSIRGIDISEKSRDKSGNLYIRRSEVVWLAQRFWTQKPR